MLNWRGPLDLLVVIFLPFVMLRDSKASPAYLVVSSLARNPFTLSCPQSVMPSDSEVSLFGHKTDVPRLPPRGKIED